MLLLLLTLGCPRPAAPAAAPSTTTTSVGAGSAAPTASGAIAPVADGGIAVATFHEVPFPRGGYADAMALSPSGHRLATPHPNHIRIFDAATGRPALDLEGHLGEVVQLAFASDDVLLSADHHGDIRRWDLAAGTAASFAVEHASALTALAVWQEHAVSSDEQGNILLWKDGQVVARLGEEEETGDGVTVSEGVEKAWIGPHGVFLPAGWRGMRHWGLDGSWVGLHELGSVSDMGFRDDRIVVLGPVGTKDYDADVEVQVTHLAPDGSLLRKQVLPVGDPYGHDLAPDGSTLAIWDGERGLVLHGLDPVEERLVVQAFPSDEHVEHVQIAAGGSRVAVRSAALTNVVDVPSATAVVDTRHRSPGEMQQAHLGADGLAVMSDRERLWLWDPLGETPIRSYGIGADESLDRIGDHVIGFDGGLLWSFDLQERELLWEMTDALGYTMGNDAAASVTGDVVVYGGSNAEIVWVDDAMGQKVEPIETPSEIWEVLPSQDGRKVAASFADEIGIWDLVTGERLGSVDQEADRLLGWHGDTLAFTGDDEVWTADLGTGEVVSHGDAVWLPAAFSQNGRWLAWRDPEHQVWAKDLKEGVLHAVPDGGHPSAMAFDPDGEHLLVASIDRTAALFRTADLPLAAAPAEASIVEPKPREPKDDLPPHVVGRGEPFEDVDEVVAWSLDGRIAARLDYGVVVTVDGEETLNFRPHIGYTDCLAVSPDGKVLATGGTDDLVRLWAVEDGRSLGAVRALGPVQDIRFADDERIVFVARPEGRSPTMGAARVDGSAMWLRSDLPYRHSDAFAIRDERVVTFHMDKVEFLDLSTGAVVARMPSYDAWILRVDWSSAELVTWDGENTYRWDTSWLP